MNILQVCNLSQKYLDHQAYSELQAFYALQALVTKLEHPAGMYIANYKHRHVKVIKQFVILDADLPEIASLALGMVQTVHFNIQG